MEPYIFSFGFPTSATTVTSGVTHLSNQKYDICIRRAKSYCYICYSEWKAGTAVIAQGSFGLRYDYFYYWLTFLIGLEWTNLSMIISLQKNTKTSLLREFGFNSLKKGQKYLPFSQADFRLLMPKSLSISILMFFLSGPGF